MAYLRATQRRTKAFYGELTLTILALLAATGAITVAGMLGGSGRAARALMRVPGISVRALKRTLRRLREVEYIGMAERDGEVVVTITERGRQRALRAQLDHLELRKPKRWDRTWRVIIFDIPEKQKLARDELRRKLRSLMFYPLQRSVYVTPYPCCDELDLLNEVYGTRPFAHCIEAKSLGPFEERVRRHFRLR